MKIRLSLPLAALIKCRWALLESGQQKHGVLSWSPSFSVCQLVATVGQVSIPVSLSPSLPKLLPFIVERLA